MILKQTFIALSLFLVPTLTMGAAINLEARGDYESYMPNTAVGTPHYQRFNMGLVRVNFQGNLTEDLSYRLRFRLSTPLVDSTDPDSGRPSNTGRDSLNRAVDFAFIRHKFGDVELTAGKQASFVGGAEGNTSSSDLYLRSNYFSETDVIRYVTGVATSYRLATGSFTVMFANPSKDQRDEDKSLQLQRTLVGLVYQGEWSEKTWLPWVSYHRDELQDSASDWKEYLSLGSTYNLDNITLRGDVHRMNHKERFSNAGKASSSLTEVGLSAAYRWNEKWGSELKLTSGTSTDATSASQSNKSKLAGYQLSTEFYPTGAPKDFRYHVALFQTNTTPENQDTETELYLQVGFRLNLSFLE